MRTEGLVARVLDPLKGGIHAARLRCLSRVVTAAMRDGKLSLTPLGRALRSGAKPKHDIKRVDVLLGNRHLIDDAEVVQQHFAGLVKGRRPILLIDWTDLGKRWSSLAVSYAAEGRALPLCWEVCSKKHTNSAAIESKILKRIASLMPDGVNPIVVTDAGFRGPWLKKVLQKGWDFVGRVRGRVRVRRDGGDWHGVRELWSTAKRTPTDLGKFEVARYLPTAARLISLLPKKGQQQKALPRIGRRKKRNIQSAREPLILATSLDTLTAKEVAEIYKLRWQIEMMFRDQKCGRFGLGLDDIRTKQVHRARAYMLLAALAHFVAFVLGATAEKVGLAGAFQANTLKKRRVLSWPRLGCELVRSATHLLQPLLAATALITTLNRGDP